MDFKKWILPAAIVGGVAYAISRKPEESSTTSASSSPVPVKPKVYDAKIALKAETAAVPLFSLTKQGLKSNVIAQDPYVRRYANFLIQEIESGDPRVFLKNYTAKQSNASPDPSNDEKMGRWAIEVNDWNSFRYFSTLLALAMFFSQSQEAAPKEFGQKLLDWFFFHRWRIGDKLRDQMLEAGVSVSCTFDGRYPEHNHRNYPQQVWRKKTSIQPKFPIPSEIRGGNTKHFPAIQDWGVGQSADGKPVGEFCFRQDLKGQNEKIDALNQILGLRFFGMTRISPTKVDIFGIGPTDSMLEYAAARFIQVSFTTMISPQLGIAAVNSLTKMTGAGMGMAIAGLSSIGKQWTQQALNAATGNWIQAGISFLVSLFTAIFEVMQDIDRTRKNRIKVFEQINYLYKEAIPLWTGAGKQGGVIGPSGGVSAFSGHRLFLLVPKIYPWDDVTDDLFHHFGLVSTILGNAGAIAQMPYFYLGIDFCLPLSKKAVTNQILCLQPEMNSAGTVIAFESREYSPEEYQVMLQSVTQMAKGAGLKT